MNADKTIDAKGLACPMPIIKTKKAMDELSEGQILEVHATDKGAVKDMAAWAKSSGNELVDHEESDGVYKFYMKKG